MIFWGLLVLEVAALVMGLRQLFRGAIGSQAPRITPHSVGAVQRTGEIFREIFRSPLVLVLAFAVFDHVALEALHAWLDGAPRPFTGARSVGYHSSVAIVTAWPALLGWASWRVFAAPSPLQVKHRESAQGYGSEAPFQPHHPSSLPRDLIFGAWLIVAGGLAAVYPLPRGMTGPILHGVELAFVAVAMAALPAGWRSRAIVTPEGRALGLLVVVELVVAVLGAWGAGAGVFTSWDELARVPYALGWAVLCVVLARR